MSQTHVQNETFNSCLLSLRPKGMSTIPVNLLSNPPKSLIIILFSI